LQPQARAVGRALPRAMTEDEVNAAGYEGEKGYHGTPSGIDNTAATFGGVLKFARTAGAPKFEKKALPAPIRVVYASTGITASTTAVVADVAAKRESDPAWFDAVPNSNLQLDFNVSVCDGFDATSLAWLRELDESNRFV
jgi:mevalonate kinase